jgi:proteasome lid subunit RPN8/RPN11
MKLTIAHAVYDDMVRTAIETAPLEACGLLGGTDDHVTRFYKLTNADASSEHFSMIPAEQFSAVKDMRAGGLRMLAIWHSHPASPPRMSDEDLRLALTPDVAYIILSLASDNDPVIKGFQVSEGIVAEIKVVIDHE